VVPYANSLDLDETLIRIVWNTLKIIADEIFGRRHFINKISVKIQFVSYQFWAE